MKNATVRKLARQMLRQTVNVAMHQLSVAK
jgi:hypothetical protein